MQDIQGIHDTTTTRHHAIVYHISHTFSLATLTSTNSEDIMLSRYFLPWWWLYVVWMLSMILAVCLSLVIVLYGLKMGYQGSVDWLISFFTAWINDTFVMQPLQIIGFSLMAVVLLRRTVDIRSYSAEYHTSEYRVTDLSPSLVSKVRVS